MRTLDIEAALRWAFRDELSKPGRLAGGPGTLGSSWGMVASYVETLVKARTNRFGIVPNFAVEGEPDPDAIKIGEAVMALDVSPVVVPEGWNPCEEMALDDIASGLMRASVAKALERVAVKDACGDLVMREKPSRLMIRYALGRVGSAPEWEIDRPSAKAVLAASGGRAAWFRKIEVWEGDERGNPELGCWRTIEQDGWNARAKRPCPDAYRKYELDPDPCLGIEGRIEYEVWRDCLDVLYGALRGLTGLKVNPCRRLARPWEGGRSPKIFAAQA